MQNEAGKALWVELMLALRRGIAGMLARGGAGSGDGGDGDGGDGGDGGEGEGGGDGGGEGGGGGEVAAEKMRTSARLRTRSVPGSTMVT
jgi:hypothetical protein